MEEFPDGLLTLDGERRIRDWLGSAGSLFGLSPRQALGSPVTRLLADARDERLFDAAAVREAGRLDAALPARGARGTFAAAFTISPYEDGMAVVVRPLDDALTPAGARPERWRALLGGTLRRLLDGGLESLEEMAPRVVAEGSRLLPGLECLLTVVPAERPRDFQVVAGAGAWGASLVGASWPQAGTPAGTALRLGRPLDAIEPGGSRSLAPLLHAGGARSAYLVPLLARRSLPGRRRLGVLGFYRQEPRFFTPYQRALIRELAELVSLALERAELQRVLGETSRRLEVGVDMALDLAASLDPADVVRRLLERTLSACAADRVTLLKLEGDEVVVEDGLDVGGIPAQTGVRVPLASLVSRSGRRRLLLEALTSSAPVASRGYRMPGFSAEVQRSLATLRHTLFLPLVMGGEVDSVLVVGRRADRRFGTAEQATLRLIGNMAVLALRNARLYQQAREDGRVKSDFLNLAAHELRTPLTVLMGYLSMLEEGAFGPPVDAWSAPIRMLQEKAQDLARLVDGLLIAGRLDTGRLATAPRQLDLRTVVEGAAGRVRNLVGALGGSLDVRLPARAVEVLADPAHVGRVLDSLLDNSLSYRDGPPVITLAVEAEAGSEAARVAVEDAGRGIPAEHRERVFDRFYRLDEGGKARPGTGLGLHISRELALAQGGRLWLDWSEPGRGSRFVLELPRTRRAR